MQYIAYLSFAVMRSDKNEIQLYVLKEKQKSKSLHDVFKSKFTKYNWYQHTIDINL